MAPPHIPEDRSGEDRLRLATRARFILFAILIAAVVTGIAGIGELQDRTRRLDAARRNAATLARALEEQTASVIWASDFALRNTVDRLRYEPGLADHDPRFEATMRRQLGQLPGVRALFVIGPDGFITQDSDRDTPRKNLRDRDYFRAHQGGPNPDLFVGLPLRSRSVDSWFIGLSRRVEGPRGEFRGVAVAALETHYFETLYKELGLGPDNLVILATRGGILVSRTPPAPALVGRPLAADAAARRLAAALAREAETGAQRAGTIDDQDRIIGYRVLTTHPLTVIVGLSKAELLQPWWNGVVRSSIVVAVAIGLSLLILRLAMRHARREEEARARIAQAARLEAIGRATSGVAHDFNNILQALTWNLAGLRRISRDPRALEVLDQGLGSIQRGRRLVSKLLAIACPRPLELRPVDVSTLIREMDSLLKGAGGNRIGIETELADDLPPSRTDPARLEAAILNLVVNARDAIPAERTGSVRIRTSLCQEPAADGFVCISVADDGVGMTETVREKILEPFFTTKGEAGTGLGLAQIDMFIRETGGEIRIDSRPGDGTEVRLLLPLSAEAGETRPEEDGQADGDKAAAMDGK